MGQTVDLMKGPQGSLLIHHIIGEAILMPHVRRTLLVLRYSYVWEGAYVMLGSEHTAEIMSHMIEQAFESRLLNFVSVNSTSTYCQF